MIPDLVKITELFLIPSSFLVAALGTADTDLHKAAVSTIGLAVSAMWWICSHEAFREQKVHQPETLRKRRVRILAWFPIVFVVGWILSVVVHFALSRHLLSIDGLPLM